MLIAAVVSPIAALAFGLLPALRLTARQSADLMRQSGAGDGAPRLRAGQALVLVQVAISVPLVVGAALFLRTIYNLASVELGFRAARADRVPHGPDAPTATTRRGRSHFFDRVLQRLQTVPGVQSATLIENSLVSGWVSNTRFEVPRRRRTEALLMNRVGSGFFETVSLPIVSGRGLGVQDPQARHRVAVVNETAARLFFDTAPILSGSRC